MKKAACITIFLSLLVATITPGALAQNQSENQTIDVIGTGRIHGKNISGARDEAISDCLVTAISLVAADLLQEQVFIQSFQDINRLLFLGADKFIQDYKVLTEDTTRRVYRVMVQATVSVEKIRELLIQNDILSQNTTPLKVLLLIAEQGLEDEFYKYWWDDAYAETFFKEPLSSAPVEQGLVVVDHSQSWPVAGDSDILEETLPDPEISSSQTETISEAPLSSLPVEQEFVVVDHSRSWPVAGDSDTLEETPPDLEMNNSQTETISEAPLSSALIERGFVVVDHKQSWPIAGDSDTLVETSPGLEMSNSQAETISEVPLSSAPVERGVVGVDQSWSWPVAGDSDISVETLPGPEMSNIQAATFGARFQADVVVVGTATVKKASNVLGDELRSFEGALSVRAIRTDTGLVLAEITRKFLTADADDLAGGHRALTEAGAQTGELLAGQIQTAWQQTAKKGPIAATIVVEGNFQLSHLVAFRRILSDMPGVSGLQTRGMTPTETILSLDYDGTAQGLAEALLLNSFGGFGVHITEATLDTVRLSLVSD